MNWKLTLGSLVFLSVGISVSCLAQTIPNHEKKVFTDDDGKIYWNKHLPVYIRISPDAEEGAPSELLREDTKQRYVDLPYYFDTEGPNYIRTRWAVDPETGKWIFPKDEVEWRVYADGIAPTSTIVFSETRPYRKEGKLFFGGEVTLSLSSIDAVSGIEAIYYSINGEPYKAYTTPIELTEDKEYSVKYYAVDRVGNAEKVLEREFVIDAESPQSKLEVEGDQSGNVLSGRAVFRLTATDDLSGLSNITFRIDDGPMTRYTQPLTMAGLQQGDHTITYQAKDWVNNLEEAKTYQFYLDLEPPQVLHEILGDIFLRNGVQYVSGRAQVKLAAFDNKAGLDAIYYSTNDETYEKYEKPFYLNAEAQKNGISFYAVDKVGNRRGTQFKQAQDGTFANIDLSGPSLSQFFQGPNFTTRDTTFIHPETKILLKGEDRASGVDYLSYSLKGGSEIHYEAPFTINEPGYHTIEYFGYDQVGNRNRAEFVFFVDDQAPEITHIFDGPSIGKSEEGHPIYPSYISVFLTAQDNVLSHKTITYSLNSGSSRSYSGPIRGFGANRTIILTYSTADGLGNSNTRTITFVTAQ